MEEIKVGEYVRTPLGICKYLGHYENKDDWYEFDKLDEELWFDDIANIIYKNQLNEVIVKHSPNIIDLIEEGDYVNGCKVINKLYENEKDIPTTLKCLNENSLKNDDIKSIVTKEMMKSVEYRID